MGTSPYIVHLTFTRLANIGSKNTSARTDLDETSLTLDPVKIGIGILSKWCRLNCKIPGEPVIVNGKMEWHFQRSEDAVKFKLTWI